MKDTADILRMKLDADEPRMVSKLNDFHSDACIILTDEGETVLLKLFDVIGIDLVPMPMPLVDALVL